MRMTWIACKKTKNKPRKHVKVCALCKYNKNCKPYQKYLKEEQNGGGQVAK